MRDQPSHNSKANSSAKRKTAQWLDRLSLVECPAFTARRRRRSEHSGVSHDPIVWSRARDYHVWDVDGNKYIDLTAGFGVASVGHSHPRVTSAIRRQSKRLIHALGDVHPSDIKIELLERLAQLAPYSDAQVVLSLNGADALTTAIKTAVLHTKRCGIVALAGGYHGLEYAPLSFCGLDPRFAEPFAAQLNAHAHIVSWPTNLTAWREELALLDWSTIGAVVIEAIQARGGVRKIPDNALHLLRELCTQHSALLIADEVFTGLGRTGTRWAFESSGVTPDIVCIGKSLAGGLPVSACIAPAKIMAAWDQPDHLAIHTGTFYGYPLGCAAALATLDILQNKKLTARSQRLGHYFRELWPAEPHPMISDIRSFGLLIGIELRDSRIASRMLHALLEQGFLVLLAGTAGNVIQLSPPLSIPERALKRFVHVFLRELDRLA